MTKHNTVNLLSLLAGKRELVNVKLFRGDRELVTAEEIEAQMRSAILQRNTGRAMVRDRFPDSETEPTDVTQL